MAKAKPSMEVRQVIGARKLTNLLRSARSAYKDTRAIAGTFGEQVRQAVEHDHLHRRAFNFIKTLDRLEPEQLAETMEQFLYMYEASGLEQRAKSAPKLELVHDADAEEAEAAE